MGQTRVLHALILLESGVAVAVNMRRHGNLIAWAKERGLFVRVDRATPWGNPFVLGGDGDRANVIARCRDIYLLARPDPLARLRELRGKPRAGTRLAGAQRRRDGMLHNVPDWCRLADIHTCGGRCTYANRTAGTQTVLSLSP